MVNSQAGESQPQDAAGEATPMVNAIGGSRPGEAAPMDGAGDETPLINAGQPSVLFSGDNTPALAGDGTPAPDATPLIPTVTAPPTNDDAEGEAIPPDSKRRRVDGEHTLTETVPATNTVPAETPAA